MRHCGNRTAEGYDRPQNSQGLLPRPDKGLSKLTAHFTNQGQHFSPSIRYWLPYHGCGVQEKNAQIR
jgi:hypothetical protein